jgi:hypothetical protein
MASPPLCRRCFVQCDDDNTPRSVRAGGVWVRMRSSRGEHRKCDDGSFPGGARLGSVSQTRAGWEKPGQECSGGCCTRARGGDRPATGSRPDNGISMAGGRGRVTQRARVDSTIRPFSERVRAVWFARRAAGADPTGSRPQRTKRNLRAWRRGLCGTYVDPHTWSRVGVSLAAAWKI